VVGFIAAAAAVVGATGCCAAPSRWRARVLAVLMVACCLPFVLGAAAAVAVLGAAVALAIGARHRSGAERGADAHRIAGAVLMAGMLLLGGHGATPMLAAHAHGSAELPSLSTAVLVGAALHVLWSLAILLRPRRRFPWPMRLEAAGMAAMFGAMIAAMVLG